ncbi:MAG: hybrid sensor histidine kinase/response regulator [Elainellaceae cyanobacterium]
MSNKTSVLVVDDERTGFTVIQALLKPDGYEFYYAASGHAALTQVEAIAPDIILLDVMMPELDGIEVCHRIKSNPDFAHIPIIMVTALNSNEDLARCFEAGADDFISKPVNRLVLQARVRSLLRIKHQHDRLKSTIQMREDMSAMMVHDLRNPLTSILLGTQFVLMKDTLEDNEQEKLKLVYASGQRLNSMINELLIMAKMEAGKLSLNRTEVDLTTLVTRVVSGFQHTVQTKHLQLETHLPESNPWICADVNLLHRLLDNLVSNAVRFSPNAGKIILRVHDLDSVPESQKHHFPNDSSTVIQVVDEGPGIKKEMRHKIFDKYEMGDRVIDMSQTGLGLTFCKMVVDAHGGHISVDDNTPQGAIFTVKL